MNAATTPRPAHDQILSMPLALLDESPTNRRRTWGDLEELAASFQDVGILQPLVARPKGERFELVFGHRRKRAASIAKLEVVPVIVRSLNDRQALEAQAIENLQRQDLHPLEEAEGLEQLHALGWTAEEMAAKIGKSRAYVFGRMQLLKLGPEARDAFAAGKMTASVALLLARVPAELQLQALGELDEEAEDRAWDTGVDYVTDKKSGERKPDPAQIEPISARAAARLLREKYTLALAQAPFKRDDAHLVETAGPCTTCPKRTGNQPELFGDVASPDVCTDPVCFAAKKAAAAKEVVSKLESKGVEILEGKRPSYGGVQPPAGYVRLSDPVPYPGRATYGELLKGDRAKKKLEGRSRVVMLDERNKTVELVKTADLKAAGLLKAQPSASSGPGHDPERWKREEAARQLKREAEDLAESQAIAKVAAKITASESGGVLQLELPRKLLALMMAAACHGLGPIAEARGWEADDPKRPRWERRYTKALAKLTLAQTFGVLLEGLFADDEKALAELCGAYRVDLAALKAKAVADAKAAAKEQKCKVCGCTNEKACETSSGPCSWVEKDLCSACDEKAAVPKGAAGKGRKK